MRLKRGSYVAAEPNRGTATWVNQWVRPLLRAADGKRYSPSGLVQKMWRLAEWSKAPVAAQGPARSYVPEGKSLWRLALDTRTDDDLGDLDEDV